MNVREIIQLLNLEPLEIEGGYFRRTYLSDESIPADALPERYKSARPMMSSIFYLVTKDSFSEFHSVSSDEIYHFYMGDPVELMEISPEGDFNSTTLGQNLTIGQSLQHTVRRGSWQSLHVKEGGEYALLGCTVGPGFVLEDFHKLSWEALLRLFPKHHMAIMKYTRK